MGALFDDDDDDDDDDDGRDIAIKLFSIWRPSVILNLQNLDFLARIHSCNQNLHQCTKVHQNQIVYG